MINIENYLPSLIILISLVSSIVYGINTKWGLCLYWLSAALLNISVTFIIPRGI